MTQDDNVKVSAVVVEHPPVKPALGYRFDFKDRSIAFSGDTAPSEAVAKMAKGADVLVHEAGLFQGGLGFSKAIVLLEEGCEHFSNNAGLGHISFPKGKIAAAFEEVRRVLEREGLLKAGG